MLSQSFPRLKLMSLQKELPYLDRMAKFQLKTLFLSKMKNAGLLVTSPGSILLEATFFINVVSSLPDVTLDFKEIEQKQVLLTSGKSEITLKGKDADQYPRIQEIAASNPLVLETKLLKQLINETAFAASVQEVVQF